jgi:hypothetical protein
MIVFLNIVNQLIFLMEMEVTASSNITLLLSSHMGVSRHRIMTKGTSGVQSSNSAIEQTLYIFCAACINRLHVDDIVFIRPPVRPSIPRPHVSRRERLN